MTEGTILLKGGNVIVHDEQDQAVSLKADVFIKGNKIHEIATSIAPLFGTQVIDCKNKIVAPGFIDTHRHMYTMGLRGRHGNNLLEDYMVEGRLYTKWIHRWALMTLRNFASVQF